MVNSTMINLVMVIFHNYFKFFIGSFIISWIIIIFTIINLLVIGLNIIFYQSFISIIKYS